MKLRNLSFVFNKIWYILKYIWRFVVVQFCDLNETNNRIISDTKPIAIEQDPEKKEALIKKFLSESVEFYLSRFEKELKNNNGHFGGKV